MDEAFQQQFRIKSREFKVPSKATLKGKITVPGDKSVSHRALIFSALANGTCKITGLSPAEDCASTARCLSAMGLVVKTEGNETQVESKGLDSLVAPEVLLDAGNSGTTMRILSGLVAGRKFRSSFDGDQSLRKRTMTRVLLPLSEMGAEVIYEGDKAGFAPFTIFGGKLKGKHFNLPVASAQVQTALLLAGLQASGTTSVSTPQVVRDHTARMFKHIGVDCKIKDSSDGSQMMSVSRLDKSIAPFKLSVPSDISSAAFFMVAAACLPGSDITLNNVSMNPGRTLIVNVLRNMGADVTLVKEQDVCGEPVADVRVKYNGRLKGTSITSQEIPSGIDEIPILSIAGAFCDGEFKVSGAEELRHKESDRLSGICKNLIAAGLDVTEKADGFVIHGTEFPQGGSPWESCHDHRLAMSGLIASVVFKNPVEIDSIDSIKISYPSFENDLAKLLNG